jgi:hypothetical protein
MINMMYVKKILFLSVLIFLFTFDTLPLRSQDLGMSFSFFFPRNGYFSVPVSPFSIRGLGVHPTRFFSIESGFSLYRMSGLNVIDIPFETRDPLMGPMFSIFIPLEAVLEAQAGNVVFRAKGGGFGFYNFVNHVNYGNFDRALADYYGWEIANADISYKNKIGFGYMFGGEVILYVSRQFGINIEVNYLSGGSDLSLQGIVSGAGPGGIESIEITYPDARIDYTGWEITFGILFTNNR